MQQSLHVMKLSEAELAAMYGRDSSRAGHVQVCRQCGRWQLGTLVYMLFYGWAHHIYCLSGLSVHMLVVSNAWTYRYYAGCGQLVCPWTFH